MSFSSRSRSSSFWPIAAAVVVAASIWGLYAWRATDSGNSPAEQVAQGQDAATGESDSDGASHLVSLRATRPAQPATPLQSGSLVSNGQIPTPGETGSVSGGDSDAQEIRTNASVAWANRPLSISESRDGGVTVQLPDSPGAAEMERARAVMAKGDLLGARGLLSLALKSGLSEADEEFARGELGRIADVLLFSRATNIGDPLTGVHVVEPGDTLNAIAVRHRISEDVIARINGITHPDLLQVGQRIKYIRGPFHAIVHKSKFRMDVMLGDTLVRSIRVGLGADDSTPTGDWLVRDKLKNPDWTDPVTNRHYSAGDPENPIGNRWIALEGLSGEAVGRRGFGIHGTVDAESIGQEMSMGCVRLLPGDIEFLFDLVVVRQTRVEVRP